MNTKNLPLKFAFVAMLLAVCLWSLLAGKGLRLGIDLSGGHSLVFEIRTNRMEIERLEAEKRVLELRLEKEQDPEARARIEEAIRYTEAEMERYETGREELDNPAQRMIAIIKNRIDPQNLRGLEFRPHSNNRIEIRMPAGRAETQQAKDAYFGAKQRLEEGNIRHSDLRRLIEAPDDRRDELIARLSHGQEEQAKRLRLVIETYRRMVDAGANLRDARASEARAVEEYQRLAALRKDDPIVQYNLACSYSLVGQPDKAISALENAIELGYLDVEHINEDSDLDNIRSDPRFLNVLARLEQRKH